MMTPAIVVIAYNRPDSLKRVLDSLKKASYPEGVNPTLVISLDKCDTDDTVKVAREFEWTFGEKRVVEHPERLGLKKHVLSCGEFAKEYGSIIVLEDDLYVSPAFYEYSCKALDFTKDDDRIGGVSLYNHLFNVHVREAFCAIDDGYDNWYFQLASSWGQAYTENQWNSFMNWYSQNESLDMKANPFIPENVSGWSDKSWLKYYIAYLIETDKYFFYPRVSFTTNFGDVGSHMDKPDTDLQVPLFGGRGPLYCKFSTLDNSQAVYDAFFENTKLGYLSDAILESTNPGITICDLYGYKPVEKMIEVVKSQPSNDSIKNGEGVVRILSSQVLPYKIEKSYARQMRPVDANIVYEVPGCDYFLYNTEPVNDINADGKKNITAENNNCGKKDKAGDEITALNKDKSSSQKRAERWFYQYRGISATQMKDMLLYRIKEATKRIK